MNEKSKQVARTWIIAGFILIAVGAIVDLLVLTSNGYFEVSNFRADLQVFSSPLASLAACWAWWFLSKIAAEKSDQRPLFQKAFLGLMLQSLCLCITYMNLHGRIRTLTGSRHHFGFRWPAWAPRQLDSS